MPAKHRNPSAHSTAAIVESYEQTIIKNQEYHRAKREEYERRVHEALRLPTAEEILSGKGGKLAKQ